MGDISQKGLTRYTGRDLTIIWKSRGLLEQTGVCREGRYDDYYHFRRVRSHDTRVYKRKPVKTLHPDAKLFSTRWKLLKGEQANKWILSLFNGSGYDL
jgi:hypothetical protein